MAIIVIDYFYYTVAINGICYGILEVPDDVHKELNRKQQRDLAIYVRTINEANRKECNTRNTICQYYICLFKSAMRGYWQVLIETLAWA